MIGTKLNLNLPKVDEPLSSSMAKIRVALSAVQDSIAEKASQAGISVTGNMDFSGNGAVNVSKVVLASVSAPTAAGSLYYSGGSLWFIDSTGAVQITVGGVVNSGTTGFTGDYGQPGILAGANFDADTGTYHFYSAEGEVTYGDLKANEFSGVDYLHTNNFHAAVSITNPQTLTNASLAPLTGGELSNVVKASGASWVWTSQSHGSWGLRSGDRVTGVRYDLSTTASGTYTVTLFKQGASETIVDQWTFAGGSPVSATHTVASPVTIVDGEYWYVSITGPNNTDVLRYVGVNYTHP